MADGGPPPAEPEGCEVELSPENPCGRRVPALLLPDGEQRPSALVSKIHRVRVKYLTAFVFMV